MIEWKVLCSNKCTVQENKIFWNSTFF